MISPKTPFKKYALTRTSAGDGTFSESRSFVGYLYGYVSAAQENQVRIVLDRNENLSVMDQVGIESAGTAESYYRIIAISDFASGDKKALTLEKVERPIVKND